MSLPEVKLEAILKRTIAKYNLKQLGSMMAELEETEQHFKTFDFKKEGSRMTAVEFIQLKKQLAETKQLVKKRYNEILKTRIKDL